MRGVSKDGRGVAYPSRLAEDGEHLRMTVVPVWPSTKIGDRCVKPAVTDAYYFSAPNSAANCFSPLRVKLTMRLPGVGSRAAHFSSVNRVIMAAPSVPAR